MYWETGGLCSDPSRTCDLADFIAWARNWPEMDYHILNDDTVQMFQAMDLDHAPCLPCYRDNAETGEYDLDEERFEDRFLEELSWRVAVGETAVLRIVSCGWGEINGHAIGILGGETPPETRIVALSLDEIHGRISDTLQGARLMLPHYAA